MSLHFREWLVKYSENDQSIDFWRVVSHRKKRNIRNIENIRVQGNIYTALLFFFEEFDVVMFLSWKRHYRICTSTSYRIATWREE